MALMKFDAAPGQISGSGAEMLNRLTLERTILQHRLRVGVPGVVTEVSIDDQSECFALGTSSLETGEPITGDSGFSIACLVRFLVSLVCLKLEHAGKIDLDIPIAEYLPELDIKPDSKARSIFVRHLMMQTSGFQGLTRKNGRRTEWPWERCASYLENCVQLFRPGSVFSEDVLNHVVLGEILKRHLGRAPLDLVQELLLSPAGIQAGSDFNDAPKYPQVFGHSFDVTNRELKTDLKKAPEPEAWLAALSNMTLSVRDMAKLARHLMEPGTAEWFLKSLDGPSITLPKAVGLRMDRGWSIERFTSSCAAFGEGRYGFFSAGRGQGAAITLYPARRLSVCVASNLPNPFFRELILDSTYSALGIGTTFGARPSGRETSYVELLAGFRPEQLAGTYIGTSDDPVLVEVNGQHLRITAGARSWAVVGPLQDGRLVLEARTPARLGFFADPETGTPCLRWGVTAFKSVL